jgi:hypothetical protein
MKKLVLLLLILATAAVMAAPLTKTVTIHDPIGVEWRDELVHYALSFPVGALKGVAQVRVQAGKTALPSQVSDVARHADGSVASCKVWFFANVPANGTVIYTLLPGKAELKDDSGVRVGAGGIVLTTKAPAPVGISLPSGGKTYDWPVPASDVPGPIQSLLLPSGKTISESKLNVPFKVKSYASELTASGPCFAEAKVTYLFDAGYWTFTARVVRGCPMVLINEEFDTGYSKAPWDSFGNFYTLKLTGDTFRPTQAFYTGRTDAPDNHNLLEQYLFPEIGNLGGGAGASGTLVNGYTLDFTKTRTDYYLTAWPTWSPRVGVAIRFVEPGKDAVGFASVETMAWKNALAVRFQVKDGDIFAALPVQVYQQGWASEGYGRYSPNSTGKTLFVPETTARRSYGIMLTPAEDELQHHLESLLRQTAKLHAAPLDEVKEWTLDWPDPLATATWAAETNKDGQAALTMLRNWRDAYRALGNYGTYSMWTFRTMTHRRYDVIAKVLNDPAALTWADRQTLRRLCAYQAHVLNSLDEFPWGSGVHLGNPNMSIMAMDMRVKSALLVKDHPLYKEWGAWTLAFTKGYIERFTRDSGAPYENPHYTLGVTLTEIAQVNEAMLEAGIGDALDTPRFRACMRFLLDWSLPPDPRFFNHRQILQFGNGSSYMSVPTDFTTIMVNYYKTRDPKLAAQLQWLANRSQVDAKQVKIVADEAPVLPGNAYNNYGVFFHHGYGTPYESYFFMMAGDCEGHYEAEMEQMAYTFVAKGQPINLHFSNGYQPMIIRPWARNRVSIDHMVEETERNATRMTATAFTPEADYVHASRDIDSIRPLKTEYPLVTANGTAWAPEESASWPQLPAWQRIPMTVWHRQALFLKDADPNGPNYLVVRDTFAGAPTRPTDASFWFLANSMTREGDVYHFDGQCGADMDVYVAEPAKTEPETGKYSHPAWPYGRTVPFDPKYFPGGKLAETQLFLRLKQPVGKGYLVVLYPRLKGIDAAATYTALADGAVKVVTPLSTDYAFLNTLPAAYQDAQVTFQGTAGSVRFYKDGKIAVTNAEGKASYKVAGKNITGEGAFTAVIENGKVITSTQGAWAKVVVE